MFATRITAIGEVGGRWNSRLADDRERFAVPSTLSEIVATDLWAFVDYHGRNFPVKAEWLRHASEYAPLQAARDEGKFDSLMPPSFMKLTCLIELPDAYVDNYLTPSTPDDDLAIPRDQIEHLIAAELSKDVAGTLADTIVAANIARFGSLSYSAVFRFADDELKGIEQGISGVPGDVLDNLSAAGWPQFHDLSVADVASWLYCVEGFSERRTHTRLGRALAAATHILMSRHGDQNLDLGLGASWVGSALRKGKFWLTAAALRENRDLSWASNHK